MVRQVATGLLLLLIIVVAVVGCVGQVSPTPAATSPSPPASPANSPTPTSSGLPQPSPTAEAMRIEFSPGMTQATIEGALAPSGRARYLLRAEAGQMMEVSIFTGEEIQLSIEGGDGTVLKSAEGTPFFRGTLPSSQDYLLVLTAADQAVSYTMSVIIPERIQFSAGATSRAVEGQLPARGTHYYVLGAEAGQLMELNASPDSEVQTIIYGLDGTVLKSGMGGGASFRGTLSRTEEYIISLSAGEEAVSYTMNVTIARRIEFARAAVSAGEEGEVGPGRDQAWVLAARAGQTLKVEVMAPGADVRLVIYGQNGTVLRSGMGQGSTFEGVLPSSLDYIVVVGPADRSTSYQLEVTIL
jgi:hypothetical protein